MASNRVRRTFLWAGQVLADPDPSMAPEEVLEYYSEAYPELTNAVATPAEETDGKQVTTFKTPQATAVARSGGGSTYRVETPQGKRG